MQMALAVLCSFAVLVRSETHQGSGHDDTLAWCPLTAALTSALKDEYSDVRTAAAEALGFIGDLKLHDPEIAALANALQDEEWSVRAAAASALGKYGAMQSSKTEGAMQSSKAEGAMLPRKLRRVQEAEPVAEGVLHHPVEHGAAIEGGEHEEGEEEEPAPNSWLYVVELLLVIFLSLGFEKGQDHLVKTFGRWGKKGETMLIMMNCLFREIMILGFIGLFVFCMIKSGAAVIIAKHIFPHEIEVTQEHDPLAETFETVHMIIFCVMLVFIFQCSLLMRVASKQVSKWEDWEHVRVRGANSMEEKLKAAKYLDESGQTLKPILFESRSLVRIMRAGGILELLQWRAIRHEFLFPSDSRGEGDNVNELMYRPGDPQFFHFHEYLTSKLGNSFVDLVEIDMLTWFVAACCSFAIPVVLDFDPYWWGTIAAFCSWCDFLVVFFFGLHVYSVYYQVTPELPSDPKMIISSFIGTSAFALKRLHREKTARQTALKDNLKDNKNPGTLKITEKTPMLRDCKDEDSTNKSTVTSPEQVELIPSREGTSSSYPSREGTTEVLLKRDGASEAAFDHIVSYPARFRSKPPRTDPRRPLFIRVLENIRLLRFDKSVPNEQERLFLFEEASVAFFGNMMELVMFTQSVTTASYIVIWACSERSIWTYYQYLIMAFGLCAPLLNILWLVPKVVSKFVIVTNVEYMKDKDCCREVIFDCKRRQVLETLKILEIAKVQGKIEFLGGNCITPELYKQYHDNFYEKFSKKKQQDIEKVFKMFDADNSGTIEVNEFQSVLASLGIDNSSQAASRAEQLIKLVDRNKNGVLEIGEFRVLMAMALIKDDADARGEDLRSLFVSFDQDNSGMISIYELAENFSRLGVHLDEDDMAALVFQVFRTIKQYLDQDGFVKFMDGLEEMAEAD